MAPMQKRAEETRELIVQTAAEIFAKQGYSETALRDITSRIGMTLGAFYFHFDSKLVLAGEIVRRQHETSIGAIQSITSTDASGMVSIVRLSRELAEQTRDDAVVRAGIRLSTESVAELATVASAPYREWVAACRILLERASAQGETRPGLDLDAAADLIISAFSGTQFLSAALGRSERILHMLARMWPILLGGMLADADHPILKQIPDLLDVSARA